MPYFKELLDSFFCSFQYVKDLDKYLPDLKISL
jgi:hypothetical protein